MQKKETAPVTISRYAEKILYLQLKYGDTDFTGTVQNLPVEILSMERRSQKKDFHGQTVEQYLMELEGDLETWC